MSEPTSMSKAGPGLGFKVANPKGAPVVYITNDVTLNTLTLTITNQTGATVTLKGGTPVAEDKLTPQGPTSLYLNFGNLLTTDQIKALEITATGWQRQLMTGNITNWALTPVKDLPLGDRGSITVTIAHLSVSGQPRPGALTVDYLNVPTVNDDSFQQALAVQTPPTQPRDLALHASIVGSNVVHVSEDAVHPILNILTLSVVNPSPDTPIVPDNVPWDTDPPIFFLSFAYGTGDGYGALTTAGYGKTIGVDPMTGTTDTWTTEPVDPDTRPYWRLKPQQHEVLGVGDGGRVGFTISHVISLFKPELLPTQLYLQWAHIPGYNDGHLSLDLFKSLPTPGILGFRALTPSIINANDPVQLTWQTFAVARVTLSYTVKQQAVVIDSSTGSIGTSMATFAPTPTPVLNTTYYLDAYDAHRVKVDSRNVPITVIHPPIKIDSFTVSPTYGNFDAGPIDVTLSWQVSPDYAVKRVEVEGQGIVTGQSSYVVRGVKAPTTFHLRATGLGDDEQIASVQVQSLSEYLVGRTYYLTNGSVDSKPMRLALDYLEIRSTSRAYFNSLVIGANPFRTDKADVDGTWSLVGSKIRFVPSDSSVGTLVFEYREHSEKGEALYFENPPFLSTYGDGYERLMTTHAR